MYFQATKGFTESYPLLFGEEAVVWATKAHKDGKWVGWIAGYGSCDGIYVKHTFDLQ